MTVSQHPRVSIEETANFTLLFTRICWLLYTSQFAHGLGILFLLSLNNRNNRNIDSSAASGSLALPPWHTIGADVPSTGRFMHFTLQPYDAQSYFAQD